MVISHDIPDYSWSWSRYFITEFGQSGIAFTAASSRTHLPHRIAVFANNMMELKEQLQALERGEKRSSVFQSVEQLDGDIVGEFYQPLLRWLKGKHLDWSPFFSAYSQQPMRPDY